MEIKIGCNTLYAAGRLSSEDAFTSINCVPGIIAESGFDAVNTPTPRF